jgi:hypothetical protein
MGNNGPALSLILISQALFLFGSLIEPPSGWLMIVLRVVVPVLVIVYLGLVSAGFIRRRRG